MSDERLPPGTELHLARRYRVEAFLGAGGFAEVYRARELGIDRPVALKLLGVGPHTRPVHRQRFFREAQAAARIDHPDVVTILEHGVAPDGRPYIAQAFLDGRDLAEELGRGPLAPRRALPLFARALDALAAAHEAGVVHRDLKPANLFLDRAGTRRERLVILDFGVACFHEQLDDRLTATGGFLGTPRYMAPEYIERRQVGPAMDVYQVGLVLVEALCGAPAVQAENAYQSMVAHVNGRLAVPGWIDAGPLGPIVWSALDRDPARRPSAAALRDRLEAVDPAEITPPDAAAVAARVALADTGAAPTRDGRGRGAETPETVEPESLSRDGPPPLPYAARRPPGPQTEALSLSLWLADPDAPPDAPAVWAGPPVAAAPARRARWPVAAALGLSTVAAAALWVGREPAETARPDAGPSPVAAAPIPLDAAPLPLDAAVDAAPDAAVDARPAPIPDAAPRAARRPPIVRPPPTAPPAASPSAAPTAGELLRWRTGLPSGQ